MNDGDLQCVVYSEKRRKKVKRQKQQQRQLIPLQGSVVRDPRQVDAQACRSTEDGV